MKAFELDIFLNTRNVTGGCDQPIGPRRGIQGDLLGKHFSMFFHINADLGHPQEEEIHAPARET